MMTNIFSKGSSGKGSPIQAYLYTLYFVTLNQAASYWALVLYTPNVQQLGTMALLPPGSSSGGEPPSILTCADIMAVLREVQVRSSLD